MTSPVRDGSSARSASVTVAGRRAAGAWGWAFVVLLLVSGGMATVPGGDDATSAVRAFYGRHAGVVVVAQVIGLGAAAAFAGFTFALRRGRDFTLAGLGIVVAAVVTAIPVLWLVGVADDGSGGLVHALAVASDLADVLLFLSIAAWSAALVRIARPRWLTALAGAVAVLALARTLLILLSSGWLEVLAPVAFVALVAVLSTLLLLRRSPLAPD